MSDDEASPPGLAERLEAGTADAHDEAFRRFYAPLVRYARGFVGDGDAARDVVQDVFLKLWETRETLDVRSSLKAMLYTMVRNRALNVNRRQKKKAAAPTIPEARRQQQEHAPPPDLAVEAEVLRERIYQWVRELPERRAEAFTLSRYHGLSNQEIAETMGVAERTASTHVYHALRDLRERLDALQEKRSPRE